MVAFIDYLNNQGFRGSYWNFGYKNSRYYITDFPSKRVFKKGKVEQKLSIRLSDMRVMCETICETKSKEWCDEQNLYMARIVNEFKTKFYTN